MTQQLSTHVHYLYNSVKIMCANGQRLGNYANN